MYTITEIQYKVRPHLLAASEFNDCGPKRAESLFDDPSSKPTYFNTSFTFTPFKLLFHTHDILNIYTFTDIQFKVRPHNGLVSKILSIIENSLNPQAHKMPII